LIFIVHSKIGFSWEGMVRGKTGPSSLSRAADGCVVRDARGMRVDGKHGLPQRVLEILLG
jgi:hypothetical protein